MINTKTLILVGSAILVVSAMTFGGSLQAPPGLFKDLNDEILGDAIILNGKQLFIDDYIIDELSGAKKVLNQPVKHPRNPILVSDQPWETAWHPNRGSVMYDQEEKIFKMWYINYTSDLKRQQLAYATSRDGISWQKPLINKADGTNIIPGFSADNPPCVFKDSAETDPNRRYKMLYGDNPDGTSKSLSTHAAYSPDGLHWTPEPQNPLIPHSDTLSCPYWDRRLGRYVAYLRYGPPNTRIVSRVESEDFVHWSPKVTVLRRTNLDAPLATQFYGMRIMPYEGVYLGLLEAYHTETLKPIPHDKPWTDRKNIQLAFSRNGLTWSRVVSEGAIPHRELGQDKNWQQMAIAAAFIPYGVRDKDWDWGSLHPFQPPLVVGNQIWIYYLGQNARNWWTHTGDPPKLNPDAVRPKKGVGLATLRLDGFVSVEAAGQGTLTTKTLVFIGDQIEVNADVAGGSIQVEALDPDGNDIEGFGRQDCTPITTDSVRHVLQWNDNPDCHLIQARPIKLRFHLNKAKLYSFTPRIRHKHYVPSYD